MRSTSHDRGYVRPEDEAPVGDPEIAQGADTSSTGGREVTASVPGTVISVAGSTTEAEEDDEDVTKPLPDRLIIELTAHRTLALRDALAESPAITFQAVLHNFVLATYYRFASSGNCLEIGLRTPTFPAQAPGLRESVSAKAVEARYEAWKARLPKSENDLWDALTALDGCAQAPCSLTAHHLRSTRSTNPPTVITKAVSPPTPFAPGLTTRMSWREPDSTWRKRDGDRPSTTISVASQSPASSKRFGRQKVIRPRN